MSYVNKLMEMGAGRSWTTEDDKKLKYAVKKVAARKGGHIKDWEKVALIVGKRGDLCKDRWQNVVSPDIKKGAWSKEEDQRLLNASASCGSNMLNTMLDVFNSSSVDGKIRTLHQCQARLQQLWNGNHSRKLEEKSVEQGNIAGLYQQKAEGVGDEGVADEGVVDEGVAYAQVADALTLLQNNYNGEEELEIGDGLTNLFKTYAEADAASGIAVHNECKLKFLELKTKRTYRSIVFKIEEKQKQVIVEATGDPTETYEAFTDSLPTDECCYAVFDFDLPIPEGVPKRQILFIAWLPDTSREENKKIYASALDSFKRELDGIQIELEVTGPSEIGLDVIRNRAAKHEP